MLEQTDRRQTDRQAEQTDRQTNIIEPTFFSDPPEEISDHNAFNAKALKPLFSTILTYYTGPVKDFFAPRSFSNFPPETESREWKIRKRSSS